ncbi:hypothetical protein CWO85_02720 [Candidatus Phytoplasma ziziphi]|uniref:Uncharacterized protein n=1 Tax=Ziziphus jujuba witches'-broom phytoplasma TaxID=135727 RepID=A0A660HN40_ZIZJU|nr:hypothetical protein [Candidatus Phytoplasma ziziphi]AYJ01402.1 hypothetical protein CWO85_02720 [Candidatus Phytoplasma ziziphi]
MTITQVAIFKKLNGKIHCDIVFDSLLILRGLHFKADTPEPYFVCPFIDKFNKLNDNYTRRFYFNPLNNGFRKYITDTINKCYQEMLKENLTRKIFNLQKGLII